LPKNLHISNIIATFAHRNLRIVRGYNLDNEIMKKFAITYIEKNTYAEGLEQMVHRYAETPEEASEKFQTEEMGICERVINVKEA